VGVLRLLRPAAKNLEDDAKDSESYEGDGFGAYGVRSGDETLNCLCLCGDGHFNRRNSGFGGNRGRDDRGFDNFRGDGSGGYHWDLGVNEA